jgi:hypothetical protein
LASFVIDRTHIVRGSGMGAASAAISPLGLNLDLMEHKVLMCMRSGAWCRMAALVHGWSKPATKWMHARGKRSQGCGSYGGNDNSDGRKKRANGVNPDLSHSIYRGVHWICPLRLLPPYDAHYNGSFPIISREDRARFFVNRLSHNLSSEFRSSAMNKNVTRSRWRQQDR